MIPVFKPGNHVLTFNWLSPKVGDVVIFIENRMRMIKRVKKIEDNYCYVVGDNRYESVKIRKVRKNQITGKVIFKY